MTTNFRGKQIPTRAAQKVAALSQARTDALAMARAASEQVRDKAADLREARAEFEHRTVPTASNRGAVRLEDPNSPALQSVRRRIQSLAEQVSELQAAADARQQRAQTIGGLFQRIEAFINRLPDDHVLEGHTPAPPKLAKGESPPEAIEALRKTVRELKAEIARVRSLPVTPSEAKEKIRAEVAALVEKGRPNVAGVIGGFGAITWPDRMTAVGYQLDVLPLLTWLNRDAMLDRLEAEVDAIAGTDGISGPDRAKTLIDLERRRLETERIEELLLERMEAEGYSVLRRPDSDLRAVLHLSDTTPIPEHL